ncbi:pyridoxal phosphate-dependent aminotransferase [Bacteroidota bacterium]
MPHSPIRRLAKFAEKAKKDGKKVYHLNIGQPDILTPQIALDAVKNNDLKIVGYTHSAGNYSYRKKLVEFYKRYGLNITEEQLLVTTGGSEAIIFGFMTCMDDEDEVIIPEPFYANYAGFAAIAGVKVVPITSTIENNFALPPIEDFEKAITKRTRAIMISNPNNPTGYVYHEEELLKLSEIVKKYDLYLFSDEVYRDFIYTDIPYHSVLELKGLEEHTILIDSISKRYSSCGMRIGTLITRNENIINTSLKFAQARLSPPSYGQIAAEALVDTPAEYFHEAYNEYIERRDYMVNRLNHMQGVYSPVPNGAFYTFARLPVDNCDRFAQWLLEKFELNNETVMLAPGTGFYVTPNLGTNEVRIAYVLNRNDLEKAMNILEKALLEYPGRVVMKNNVSVEVVSQ